MKLLGILIGIAAAIALYLLLRFITKRLWLFHQFRRFARKYNYTCTIPRSCLLPNNRNHRYVQIRTQKTVYNIKLFGLLRKHCEIHFWNTQEYSSTWFFTRMEYTGSTSPLGVSATHRRTLGNTAWLTADGVPVLLISPAQAPVRITQTDVNHLVSLRAGEKVGDAIFADLDYLLRHIEHREK